MVRVPAPSKTTAAPPLPAIREFVTRPRFTAVRRPSPALPAMVVRVI